MPPTYHGHNRAHRPEGHGGIEKPLRDIITSIVEPLRMNDDGTSYYDIVPILSGAKNTSLEAFTKNDQLDLVPYTGSSSSTWRSSATR